jgi:hypothetical protein
MGRLGTYAESMPNGQDDPYADIEHEERVTLSALQIERIKANRKVNKAVLKEYAPYFEGIGWWKNCQQ